MIEKNRETNTYHAVCDCCFEYSDEYDGFNECQHGIKYEGWNDEGEWEHFCPNCRED